MPLVIFVGLKARDKVCASGFSQTYLYVMFFLRDKVRVR